MIREALETLNNRNIDKYIIDEELKQEYLKAVSVINEFVLYVVKIGLEKK